MKAWVFLNLFNYLFIRGQCSTDITWPTDTEATIGSDVVLDCISPSAPPREWHHLPIGYSTPEISHRDGSCLNGYCARRYSRLSNTLGQYSLHIPNVSIEDAGIHRCVLRNKSQGGAELNILVKYPSKEQCSAQFPTDGVIGHNECMLKPDNIALFCSLNYVGNVVSYLEWIQTAGNNAKFYVANTTSRNATISTLMLADGQLQEATFLCRIRHLNSNMKSILQYSIPIKTIPLRLRRLTVHSELSLQQVNCSSNLPYECSYVWKHKDSEVSSSPTLNLISPKDGLYSCFATCDVRRKSWCTFKSYEVTYQQIAINNPPSETINIGYIVICILAVLVVVGIAIFICVICRRRIMTCVSTTATEEQQEDQAGSPATENLFSQPHQEKNEEEESDKLLEKSADEAPSGDGCGVRYDDENEANIAEVLDSLELKVNFKLRNANRDATVQILDKAEDEEETDTDTYETESEI